MRPALCLFIFAVASQAGDHQWQTGEIVDSEIASTTITPGAVASGSTIRIIHRQVTDTNVIIRGAEYEYVAEREPSSYLQSRTGVISGILLSRDHGCRFIVGDRADYSAEGGKLYVIDADGKQCKLNIIRQAHLEPATQAQLVPQPTTSEQVAPRPTTSQQAEPKRDFDFRHVYWGMSTEEVIAAEGQPDKSDERDLIFDERDVAGHAASIVYHFRSGRLIGASVAIASRIAEKDALQVFADWKSALDGLYGKGAGDVER
ncbi:MAG: hypothetical protein JOZ62_09405, partial [Acidobacteriaceae bacterium]|nr:hypothetical protein [Acidobacteriaceae bacterium]